MNDLSINMIYLAFLSMPGIIGTIVYKQLIRRRSLKTWQEFLEILLFSVSSYLVYALTCEFVGMLCCWHPRANVLLTLNSIDNKNIIFPWGEIFLSTAIGVLLAFAAAFLNNYKLINRFGRLLHITNRYGDEDVWDFLFNIKELTGWVFVRDHKTDRLYFGKVGVFSESAQDRELILTDVDVYRISNEEKLFHRDLVYLSKERYDLSIEIYEINSNKEERISVCQTIIPVVKKVKSLLTKSFRAA